jgi:hypothetical protein
MYGFIFRQKSHYCNPKKHDKHGENSSRLRMWSETGKLLKINEETTIAAETTLQFQVTLYVTVSPENRL